MQKIDVHGDQKKKINEAIIQKGAEEFADELITKFKAEGIIRNVGSGNYRINPCPSCGHNDCFTFNDEGMFHCFSCQVSGSLADLPMLFTENQALAADAIYDFTGISVTPDPGYKEKQRQTTLYADAAEIYHQQLIGNPQAFTFLTQVRKRRPETIEAMQTGFCGDIVEVQKKLRELGYTQDEIKSVYIPQGLFVYPYFDLYGQITRFNTKNYLHAKKRGPDGEETEISGHSIGKKQLLFNPGGSYHGTAVLVEGEQDFATLIEQGCTNAVATGGQPSEEQIKSLRRFNTLYLLFDNDEGGRGFTEKVNEMLPDIKIYKIDVPMGYKDIDEYYAKFSKPVPFQSLLESAVKLENDGCHCYVEGGKAFMKNRDWRLEFEITGYDDIKKRYRGNWKYCKGEKIDSIKSGVVIPDSLPKPLLTYGEQLEKAINDHFNSDFDKKTLDELESIYEISPLKNLIIKAAAVKFTAFEDKTIQEELLSSVKNLEFRRKVQQELICLENEAIQDQAIHFPSLNPGQAYAMNTDKPIAYMYFNLAETSENGIVTEEPCLLTSDRRIIRLCDYTRKTPNQLLIIDGRFRIQNVVKGPLLDSEKVSLKMGYVKQYIDGKIDPADLEPGKIVRSFEKMLRKVYYSKDPDLHKILALYAYATYYADLFGVMPYIYLTAEKGSGKSTILSMMDRLCFNSIFVTDTTAAALLRVCNLRSTFILDEFENRSSRSRNADDDIIPIIKSGYSKYSGGAIRTNMEEMYRVDSYAAYGPKIFASIGTIDDVLQDRSICIILKKLPAGEIKDTMDISIFNNSYGDEMTRLSSYAALSALEHFQTVYDKFNITETACESARSNQILKPLYTLAAMIGEDYTAAVDKYSVKNEQAKKYVDSQSVEGVVKGTLKLLAQTWFSKTAFQAYGRVPVIEKDEKTGKYRAKDSGTEFPGFLSGQVKYDGDSVLVNTAVLTVMANQLYDYGSITIKQVHNALARIMPDKPLTSRTTACVKKNDTDYSSYFNNKDHVSCYNIRISIKDYELDKIYKQMQKNEEDELEDVPF